MTSKISPLEPGATPTTAFGIEEEHTTPVKGVVMSQEEKVVMLPGTVIELDRETVGKHEKAAVAGPRDGDL